MAPLGGVGLEPTLAYPVAVEVTPLLSDRNRLTTFFRLILAIPHIILVGGIGMGVATREDATRSSGSETGLLGAVAVFMAIISWFTLVFAGTHISGIRQFTSFYLRWRVRALSYLMLLQDQYPPFGDLPYPASIDVPDAPLPRNRLTIAFRLILAIPHFVVLIFVLFGFGIVTIIAWFAIVFTGAYPASFYPFAVGAMRWRLRVEAYMLLMTDEYPPFSLD